MKQKHSLRGFFLITFLHYTAANFAHPVTPTLIQNLGLGDYMFGLAFASMAFTNFLFSPFWGKLRDYIQPRILLIIACTGYALGQIFFSAASTELTIVLARCFSGIFTGAVSVSTLVYVVDNTAEEQVGENLTKLAITQSLAAALGYFAGGVIGVYSIRITFLLQAGMLLVSGILYLIFAKDMKSIAYDPINMRVLVKDANPLQSFINCRVFMTRAFFVLFLVVLFANLGTNAFDQCFNYYIKDQFNYTSAYNGIIKALIGIITLIANSTICMWIIRRADIKRPTCLVLACCAASILLLLLVKQLTLFFVISILFYAFNAIYIPLLQNCVSKDTTKNSNLVMGFYNAVRSLGMIGGALIAGGIYALSPILPFAFAGICFLLAAVLLWVNQRIQKTA